MTTQLAIIPNDIQLPAHLQSPDIAAQIAAANAAAAGGVRAGGFPSISIKANKFHIKDGDQMETLMTPPAAPGQPALPMMCLEVLIVDANPALSHTFFPGEYVEGESIEPACRSQNGVTPDADVANKQSPVCATCPQYQWGSKISKLSQKPIRACSDSKQMAVLPAADLNFKMLGLNIKAGSLKNWGLYIQALSGRGYGVDTLVTNVMFDQTQNGVLQFSFNRFLTAEEYAAGQKRKLGDDVRLIVAQSRTLAPNAALPAPVAMVALPPAAAMQPASAPAPAAPAAPAASVVPPAPIQPPPNPAPTTGFGAAPATPAAAAPAAEKTRKPRTPAATGSVDLSHVPEAIRATINQVGADSPAGQALLAMYPPPAVVAVDPYAHVPAAIMATVNAVGVDSVAGKALLAAYPAPGQPAAPAPTPVQVAPAAAAPVAATPVAAAPTSGFGGAPAAPAAPVTATPAVVAAGASLAEKLKAKLAAASGTAPA